ncbi:MAG: DNA alkylation repair protein [Fluviicola sp.]|nr:DNA alkylation repair protein [Fluviicola sp.]
MEPLKELFNRAFYEQFADAFTNVYTGFERNQFVKDVTKNFEPLSLNERMRNTSVVLQKHLPADYEKALEIMFAAVPTLKTGYTTLVFPDFVSQFGLKHQQLSLEALKYFTGFGSSEFAIRVFLKKDFENTLKTMVEWAGDENHHVRRLASEGSRPRLPWSFKLPQVIENPKITQPILEQLKADPELYVRKSVANHLNDFSKDNPDYMLDLVGSWDRSHPHTAWIVKHGTRTLIKKGNAGSIAVFGFEKEVKLRVENFRLVSSDLKLGDVLDFSFDLVSEKQTSQKLVVDYIIHYRKSAGDLSPKVFKLKELNLEPNQRITLSKKQRIQDFTTRKHYAGEHVLEIQVNGVVMATKVFQLIV